MVNVLFLTNRPARNTQAATVTEYLDALHQFSKHQVYEISMLHDFPNQVDLERFDVIISHYSLSLGPLLNHYLGRDLVEKLKKFKGLKAAFLQDEYREIQTYWKHLNELGIDVLFSCVPEHEIPKVYPKEEVPNLRVVNVLTGYVSTELVNREVPKIKDRSIDIGYRTRKMPYWLGRLGYEKWLIAKEFKKQALELDTDLILDLSYNEGERLYGEAWTNFIASSRAVLGVESGASIIDFDGKLEHVVEEYVSENPEVTYEEVHKEFLVSYEGSLDLNQISPRCFEAAALRTPMVLFEGDYSGILQPNRHFIPLKKDFSNFSEVLDKLKDHDYLQELADRVYQEIVRNPDYGYQAFISKIDLVLENEIASRGIMPCKQSYSHDEFHNALRLSIKYYLKRRAALFFQSVFLGTPILRRTIFSSWGMLPRPLQRIVRPFVRIISR
jgi:hypothetical protein